MELLKPSEQPRPHDENPDSPPIILRLPRIRVPYGVRLAVGTVLLTVAVLTPPRTDTPPHNCAPPKSSPSHPSQQPWEQRAEVLLGAVLMARRSVGTPTTSRRPR